VLVRSVRKGWSQPYKDGATVQYGFDQNLAVWLQFRPKKIVLFATIFHVEQKSSTASDFEFPCKPLLGPSPELMQPQPSLRVVHGSIVWRQHMGGAHRGAEMGGFGAERRHSEVIIALAVPAWHRTVHRTVIYRLNGKVRSPKYARTPCFKKRRSVPSQSYRTV